jgi:hypothetical protein
MLVYYESRKMKLVIASLSAILVWGGVAPVSNAWAAFDPAAFANVCPPQTSAITSDCGHAICSAVDGASKLDPIDQAAFGGFIAGFINQYGNTNPQIGDTIQGCVAGGPEALIAAYEQGRSDSVAEIGKNIPASDQ